VPFAKIEILVRLWMRECEPVRTGTRFAAAAIRIGEELVVYPDENG
jgi:hypothetical protein